MKVPMTKRSLSIVLTLAAVSMALTGAALATASSGIVSATVVARSSFVTPVDIKFRVLDGHEEIVNVRDARETVMQQIVIGPGGSTGWHSHPGPVVVLVKSGELTLFAADSPCTAKTYSAGQAFIDSGGDHVHIGNNLSRGQNAELWVTYFDVPPGGAFRIDAADPGNCAFEAAPAAERAPVQP
jgi:quercetin dioxygenase-like cupin family protein